MWASFFLINGNCSSNPDCMRRMNTQSTAAALQATLSFVLTIQMSSRAWRTLQKQRRARGAWLQSGSTFFLIYRGFPWLCFPVMMLCQLLFMILSQLSARCELQRSYDFRAGSKSSPSDSLRAFGRAGWWAPVRTVRICVGFRARVICNVKPGSTSIAAALNRSTCSGSYKITAWAGEADWSRGRRRRCVLWPCKSEWICKPWLKEETGGRLLLSVGLRDECPGMEADSVSNTESENSRPTHIFGLKGIYYAFIYFLSYTCTVRTVAYSKHG